MSISKYLNKILVFLRLRKPKAGCTFTPLSESRLFWDFQLFNIDDHNRRSRLVDLYYVFYRFFKYSKWANPFNLKDEIKWFIQRGRRGWADCDTWSLDHYLDSWMPDALRYLKAHKHGIPLAVIEPEDQDPDSSWARMSEEGEKRAAARWDTIMEKMIAAFEAHDRQGSGLYEKELGPYPLGRPSGVSASAWAKAKDDRFKASQLLSERDQKLFEEGMALFVKYYGNLWD